MHRISHRVAGVVLAVGSLWIASDGFPAAYALFAFVAGTVLMRSAGCAINDWADRDFDRHVARTRDRPLTAGLIRPWEAVAVFVVLSLVALALIVPFNRLTWVLAFVAAFLAVSYPFTKRFLALPQAYLGIAFGVGIPMAFAAVLDTLPLAAWLMLAAGFGLLFALTRRIASEARKKQWGSDIDPIELRDLAIVSCAHLCIELELLGDIGDPAGAETLPCKHSHRPRTEQRP